MSNSNYWSCVRALKLCGCEMRLRQGYKLYRYNPERKYDIIDLDTNKVVIEKKSVFQIYNWLIKQGVIILD